MKNIDLDTLKDGLPVFTSEKKCAPFFGLWMHKKDPTELKVDMFFSGDFLLEKLGPEEYNKLRKALGTTYRENGKIMLDGKEVTSSVAKNLESFKDDLIESLKKELGENYNISATIKENE